MKDERAGGGGSGEASSSSSSPAASASAAAAAEASADGAGLLDHGGGGHFDLRPPRYPWVERYLDENRPDPLSEKQARGWTFEWGDAEGEGPADRDGAGKQQGREGGGGGSSSSKSGWQQQLRRRVAWRGDHACVVLRSECEWTDEEFRCAIWASAELAPPAAADEAARKDGKRKAGAGSKIQRLVAERLSSDDYVAKLLGGASRAAGGDDPPRGGRAGAPSPSPLLLCEARILAQAAAPARGEGPPSAPASPGGPRAAPPQVREERYGTDEAAAEAIRRCVWSSADDATDVLQFVVQYLPLLPAAPAGMPNGLGPGTAAILLADRARLRLLEDALVDACQRQADDEMVGGLGLGAGLEGADEGRGEGGGERSRNSGRPKKSRRRHERRK
jgi:hypothetical protein